MIKREVSEGVSESIPEKKPRLLVRIKISCVCTEIELAVFVPPLKLREARITLLTSTSACPAEDIMNAFSALSASAAVMMHTSCPHNAKDIKGSVKKDD